MYNSNRHFRQDLETGLKLAEQVVLRPSRMVRQQRALLEAVVIGVLGNALFWLIQWVLSSVHGPDLSSLEVRVDWLASAAIVFFAGALAVVRYRRSIGRNKVFLVSSAFTGKDFYADLIRDTVLSLERHSYQAVLRLPGFDYSADELDRLLTSILEDRRSYEGGIIVTLLPDTDQAKLARFAQRFRKPVVIVDYWHERLKPLLESPNLRFVMFDNRKGGKLAAKCVLAELCRRGKTDSQVLVIGSSMQTERQQSFKEELETLMPSVVVQVNNEGEFQREKAAEIVGLTMRDKHPEAIFCTNDEMALGVLRAVESTGRTGRDVFIVGYDAIPEARSRIVSAGSPLINCVNQPTQQLATKSVRLLADMLEGEELDQPPRLLFLDPVMFA